MRSIYFLIIMLSIFVSNANAQTPRYSELECVANAQAIALDYGKEELNKQMTINFSRGLAMDLHRWLMSEASKITSQQQLKKYNLRVSDYRLDNYNRRMERVGYCLSWYVME